MILVGILSVATTPLMAVRGGGLIGADIDGSLSRPAIAKLGTAWANQLLPGADATAFYVTNRDDDDLWPWAAMSHLLAVPLGTQSELASIICRTTAEYTAARAS